jgi:aralkylamine N-acetyltransferase
MQTFKFEITKSAPANAIIALYNEAGWWKESPRSRKLIPNLIKGSFCFLIAKSTKNEIIGMGRVLSDGVSDGYIQDVIVKKDFRGQGVGLEIISRLTQYCLKKRLEWIGLVAEPGTTTFYNKNNFKELIGYVPMRYL